MTNEEFVVWRKGEHMSQPDAAAALDVSRATVARWESGQTPIPAEVVALISEITGVQKVEARVVERAVKPDAGFDPIAAGLKPGPTTNEIFGAGMGRIWDPRKPLPGWKRVAGGIRIVKDTIPSPINYEPPAWAGWRGVVTADGRVFDYETGHEMKNYNDVPPGRVLGGFVPNMARAGGTMLKREKGAKA